MKEGDRVILRAYGGEEILRRFISGDAEHVFVCRDEEYDAARVEGRAPRVVGFSTADVLATNPALEPHIQDE